MSAVCLLPVSYELQSQIQAAEERPNVILVMADDLGWGDPRCFNPESIINTPNIDAMAAAGLKFNRFYSGGPVCSPTRGSCLTGRNPYRYGIYNANTGHMKAGEITLPEILRELGYATGHFGKWHLGTLTTQIKDANRGGPSGKAHFSTPSMNGYDVCMVTESKVPTFNPMIKPPNASKNAWDVLSDGNSKQPYGTHYWNERGDVVTENLAGDDSRIIMDRAIPFIEQAVDRKRPFFTVVWFHAPHLPVVAGPEHVAPYLKHGVYERNYYGCISALDEQVGRLRKRLRELGIAENTMLWFCSDNGPEGNEGKAPGSAGGLRGRKRSLYEGGVRVPGILEWPGHVTAGRVTEFPAVTSDYLPTVLDLLATSMPDDRPIDGVSLLPLIEGRAKVRNSPIGFQSGKQVSVVEDQYKLYSSNEGRTWALYDLDNDRAEANDLAADNPDRVASMAAWATAWRASCSSSDAEVDYK
ncbi:MAG: sulfatase-like hydrolase/transferase [Planctomycetota bacterium]|nr:sulfatase-like hydrolase/transferase [Planctomycetota bacterium]